MAKGACLSQQQVDQTVDSRFMVYVDSVAAGQPAGTFYHFQSHQPFHFSNMGDLVLQIDQLLDRLNHPERFLKKRHWGHQALPAPQPFAVEDMPVEFTRSRGQWTFTICVMTRQHGTWQGDIRWVEKDQKVYFRSALELLTLLQAALKTVDR